MNYNQAGKEVRGRSHTFYQVLIDVRDCPYVRAQTEAVTFLGSQNNGRTLYAVPGLDYVAHEDIMPYTAGDNKKPIRHDLFERFLDYYEGKGNFLNYYYLFYLGNRASNDLSFLFIVSREIKSLEKLLIGFFFTAINIY